MSKSDRTRRGYLRLAALGTVGLSGCLSSTLGVTEESPTETASPSQTENPTATSEPTESPTEEPTATDGRSEHDWFVDRGTVLDDFGTFESDWRVQFGTATLDGAGFLTGEAVRMSTDGDSRVRIVRSFESATDLSDRDFTLALNLESSTRPVFQVKVVLEDVDGNRRYHTQSLLNSATDTWVHLDTAFASGDDGFDAGAVAELWIEHYAGDDESTFRVDDLRTLPKPDRAAVMLTFDDRCEGDAEFAHPVLSEYGFKGVCFPPSLRITEDTPPTISDYQAMRDDGWDIGGHTPDHERLSEYSRSEQRDLFETNVRQLREKSLVDEDDLLHFRTPYGNYDTNTLEVVLETFDTCIVGAGMATGSAFYATDPRMIAFRSGEDFEETKALIREAVEHRQLLGLTLHACYVDREYLENLVEFIAPFASRGDLDVITMSEFYERSGP